MIDELTYEQQIAITNRPRLVIADDDPFVRSMLTAQLQHEFECVGAAADADEATAAVSLHRPDVVILDANMPGGGAMHATHEIRVLSPETAIVILSVDETRSDVIDLLGAGAIAYLRKGIEPRSLVHQLIASINAHRNAARREDEAIAEGRGEGESSADLLQQDTDASGEIPAAGGSSVWPRTSRRSWSL